MAPILPNVLDILSPRLWTGIIRDIPIPQDYIFFDGVLKERSVPSDRLEWDVLKADNPIAPFVSLSAESPRALPPQTLNRMFQNALFIRLKEELDEKDLRVLRTFGTTSGSADDTTLQGAMASAARDNLMNTAARLRKAVSARKEWLALNALMGDVNMPTGDVIFRMQYPVVTQTASPLWSDVANSDPILDMQTWFKDNFFFTISDAYMSRDVMFNLIRNTKIKQQMSWDSGNVITPPASVTRGRVRQFIQAELGITIHIYDAVYTTTTDSGGATNNLTQTQTRFLPTNKVLFLPNEDVGYMATTPALLNNYQTGDFAWTVDPMAPGAQKDPPVYQLGAGWYGFPVIQFPYKILVATVA